jgi:glycosyltransferase involved in cell wall biosynthesis
MMNAPLPTPVLSGDLILCLSHLRWNFVFQRPHHLLTRACRSFQVVFLEEPIFEDGVCPSIRLMPCEGVLVATPVLPAGTSDPSGLIRAELDTLLSSLNYGRLLLWYYSPMALDVTRSMKPDLVVYDCMDELSGFRYAPSGIVAQERALLDRADLVFTGGVSLFNAKRDLHHSVHCFPSSIDTAHFSRARLHGVQDPADQRLIPHPRIGYFGVIDERLDLALLDDLALERPDWQFVMIGPLAKIDEGDLPRRDNIHWLGPKAYQELPDYLAGWDVGLMPFALNEATRYISPTKTPEFLAAGLPVVSTPVPDVVSSYGASGLVEISADAGRMIAVIETLLRSPRPGFLQEVDAALARTSWDSTWAAMRSLIDQSAAQPSTLRKEAVHV